MRFPALIVALGLVVAPAHAVTRAEPVATIAAIYRAYRAGKDDPGLRPVYSGRLQALIDADQRSTPEGEVGKIDWDVFVDGNDWELSALRIVLLRRSGAHAEVRARFKNHKQPREITFDLVRERGRWVIDDVRSTRKGARWTMTKILSGAPDAFPDRTK